MKAVGKTFAAKGWENDRVNLRETIGVSLCRGNDKDGEKENESQREEKDCSWRLSSAGVCPGSLKEFMKAKSFSSAASVSVEASRFS
ncbi:hypothetical protein QLX08_007948 [Tetragonisca angustula]|uniref:Uncharacterized protein n=1 Tax=Tetragonisca angustula TaxID=166442 RepID=A0AAW0ZNH5_9HYME